MILHVAAFTHSIVQLYDDIQLKLAKDWLAAIVFHQSSVVQALIRDILLNFSETNLIENITLEHKIHIFRKNLPSFNEYDSIITVLLA